MPKLYVANATNQEQRFMYRVSGSTQPITQPIPIGGQIMVAGRDLTAADADAVIAHHRTYGLVPVAEIDRTRQFSGLCYQLDKPIRLEEIQALGRRNEEALRERGRADRQAAAIHLHGQIEQNMRETGIPGRLNQVEMSVTEERPARVVDGRNFVERDLADAQGIDEHTIVDGNAPPTPRTSPRAPRQRRARREDA